MVSLRVFIPTGCLLCGVHSLQVVHVNDIFAIFQVIGLVVRPLVPLYKVKHDGERDHTRLEIIFTCALDKEEEFRRKQLELVEVIRRLESQDAPLPHLRTQFDSLRPDIALICDKLILFAEIWSSVGAPV